jgi:hypothetical protein
MSASRSLRLTYPDLDFWVDVTVHERDGRYMATADLGEDSRDVGVGDTPQEAVREALRSLGEPYASEMAGEPGWLTAAACHTGGTAHGYHRLRRR